VNAAPGTYLSLRRTWKAGDRVDIEMPFTFRVERALDDPAVQSIFYGPTLLVLQHDRVGSDLKTGLLNVSLFEHLKLDGDLAPAMKPAEKPLHFTTNGYTLAPFFVADPAAAAGGEEKPPPTTPYHVYVRRHEPAIKFGSIDSSVPNRAGGDRLTFLDVLWDLAPFASQSAFEAAVDRLAGEWQKAGRFTAQERAAIVDAARRAERDLRV
jgi:hypothetical protein